MDSLHGVLLLVTGLSVMIIVGCIIAYFHKEEVKEKEDNSIRNFWKDFDGK